MKTNENIIQALCEENGERITDETIKDWQDNHAACCADLDLTTPTGLIAARSCMGLPILT